MPHRILVLEGDGVGPEVTSAALSVMETVAGPALEFTHGLIGLSAAEQHGTLIDAATIERACASDAVLLGAVDTLGAARAGYTGGSALLALRRAMGLWANLRPVRHMPGLTPLVSLDATRGADILFIRELSGGVYTGANSIEGSAPARVAHDTCTYSEKQVERVVRLAMRLAAERRDRVTSVDKANVMASSKLWRDVAERVAAEHGKIAFESRLVDSFAYELLRRPRDFDVVVTENLFGDILTDEAAALTGTLGVLASASIGDEGRPGIFEPVHGSAPDIAGRDVANPVGAILAAALMLHHLGLRAEAGAVEEAVSAALQAGIATQDLGGTSRTAQVAEFVREHALRVLAPGGNLEGARV